MHASRWSILSCLLLAPILASCMPPPRAERGPAPTVQSEFNLNASSSFAADVVKSVEIHCGSGLLRVVGTPDASIVEADGRIWCRVYGGPQEAERIAREARLDVSAKGTANPAIVVTDPTLTVGQDYVMDLTVKVPSNLRVVVRDGSGNVEISGITGGIDVHSRSGDVDIHDISGGVKVNNGGDRCQIENCAGPIFAVDGPGALLISECTGDVQVRDTRGKLFIAYITGNVIAENNPEGIEIVNIDGHVHLIGIPAERSHIKGPTEIKFSAAREGSGAPERR